MAASTLGFALLGLLARQPRTGYEISRALSEPVGFFWSAGHSQVYPELARLEQSGLVSHQVVDGPGPRDTKRYTITDAGRISLADWVAQPPEASTPAKSLLLLKIYSSWLADPAACARMLRGERAHHVELLQVFTRRQAEHERAQPNRLDDPSAKEFSSYATLRAGMSYEQHEIDWFDWIIGVLDGGSPR
jgi:DNA-binding PadR family transcriptional regulator